jgi:hypothetical protein
VGAVTSSSAEELDALLGELDAHIAAERLMAALWPEDSP